MRFTCEHCGKRYSTNDVLQPDRLYRTKCKACGNVILVKGSPTATEASAPSAAPSPTPPPTSLRSTPPRPASVPAAPPPTTVLIPAPASATNSAVPPPTATTPSAAPAKLDSPAAEPKYIDLFEGETFDESPSPTPPPVAGARRKGAIAPPPSEPPPRPPSSSPSLGELFSSPAASAPETTPAPAPAVGVKQTKPLGYFGDVSSSAHEEPPKKAEPPKPRHAPEPPSAKAPAKKRGLPVAVLVVALVLVFAGLGAGLVWKLSGKSTQNPTGELPSPTTPARPTTPAEPPRVVEPTTPTQPTQPVQPSAQDLAKQAEQERLAKLEQEKAAKAEEERLAKEKVEQDRLAKIEKEKEAKAAKEAERQARIDKEKADKAAKEADRQARIDKEKADKAAKEADRQARIEKEKADKAARLEQDRQAKAEKAEQDRQAKTDKEKAEKERNAKAEQDRLAKEKGEKEKAAKAEADRLAADRAEKEKAAKAEQDRLAKLPAGLSQDVIQSTLAGAKKSFDDCVKNPSRGLEKPLEAKQLRLRFIVQTKGNVTSPVLDDTTASNGPVGQCLKAAASALVFPEFRGDPVPVEAPIALPAPPPPAAAAAGGTEGVDVVVFTSAKSIRSGGTVGDTVYSERPQDAAITEKQFENGVVTYNGQVGYGNGSTYAGIGLNVYMLPDLKPIDATRFKSVTFRLSSPTTRSLRVRIIGSDENVSKAGCYPVTLVRVSKDMKEYTFKFKDFDFETWCGSNGRSASKTIPNLTGFEIADINMQRKPTQFSVGSITLNP